MSVGALITWPYKAGGRSRRGSPKAGTTVLYMTQLHIFAFCSIDKVPKQCAELLCTYNLYNGANEVGPDSRHCRYRIYSFLEYIVSD